jgi:hypothetical protein
MKDRMAFDKADEFIETGSRHPGFLAEMLVFVRQDDAYTYIPI